MVASAASASADFRPKRVPPTLFRPTFRASFWTSADFAAFVVKNLGNVDRLENVGRRFFCVGFLVSGPFFENKESAMSVRRIFAFFAAFFKGATVAAFVVAVASVGMIGAVGAAAFAAERADDSAPRPEPTLTQFATLDSLVSGVYDGFATLAELKKYGDFGLGTFDRIDGEAIVLDGVVYRVAGTGAVSIPSDETTVPFASVVDFSPTKSVRVESQDFAALCRTLDELVPNDGVFVAFRVRGSFSNVRTRSSFARAKPYPPLDVAMKSQPEFEIGAANGELVGFRTPNFMRGLNLPGVHVHFLTDDKSRGGHVLRVFVESAELEVAVCRRFRLILPPDDSAFYDADLTVDRSDATNDVERTETKE